jgi:hypothetical protein
MSSHSDAFVASGNSPTLPDFFVEDRATIFFLQPPTPAAISWIQENLPEDHMTFGSAVVVEHRYIGAIVRGAMADGLEVA